MQLSVFMCVIGSLICNQNDKLHVILMILFLQCGDVYKSWVVIDQLCAWVCAIAPSHLQNMCNPIDTHIILKQQYVLTYVSPVELFATEINIVNWHNCP